MRRSDVVCAIVCAASLCAALIAPDCAGAVLRPGATEIVVLPKAPDTVMFAAREATNFLSRALGCEIPVVSKRTRGRTAIFLGDCEASRAAGIDVSALARDGFVVWSGADSVCIAGRDDPKRNVEWQLNHGGKFSMYFEHATAMGVYWFLEKFAGVRMYFPGEFGEIVPRRGSVKVPVGETRVKPDFTSRYIKAWDGEWFEPVDEKRADYLKTLNYMRLRLETESVPCCHGSIGFNYLRRFGKTHPEYFALMPNGERSTDPSQPHPGQLCWTSGVIEEMYQDAKSYLMGEDPSVRGIGGGPGGRHRWAGNCSGGKYVDIMPQDSFAGCRCERCKASYRHIEGDRNYATELIWGVVSNMAARLTAEGVAGTVTMMAYSPYGRIPDFELPTNVEVMVARGGPWLVCKKDVWKEHRNQIRAWTEKLGHKVWLWNYVNKCGERAVKLAGVPQMTPRAYAKCYKELAPLIRGAFAESETDRYFFNYLNYYVFSKVCWDNSVDVEELIREHHELMFGAGADEMDAFYKMLEKKWLRDVLGNVDDTPVGPVFRIPQPLKLWREIYSPELLGRCERLFASARAKLSSGSAEARRLAFVKSQLFDPLKAAGDAYLDGILVEREMARRSRRAGSARKVELGRPAKTYRSEFLPSPNVPGAQMLKCTNAYGLAQWNLDLKPDTLYRVSYFIKLDDVFKLKDWKGPVGGATVEFHDGSRSERHPYPYYEDGTFDWLHRSFTVKTPPKDKMTETPYVMPRMLHCSGTAFFDGIQIEEVDAGEKPVRFDGESKKTRKTRK